MAFSPLDQTQNINVETQLYNINRMLSELYGMTAGGMNPTYSVNVSNASFTALAADIYGGNDQQHTLNLVGQTSGSPVITLPTVVAVVTAINAQSPVPAFVGQAWVLRVLNPGPQTWTVIAPAGWTLPQPISIASGAYQDILLTLTSVTPGAMTGTAVPMGTGTVTTSILPVGSFSDNGPLNALPVEVQSPPVYQIWGIVTAINNNNVDALLHVWVAPLTDLPYEFSQNIALLFLPTPADMPEAIWVKLSELQNTNMFALGAFVQWALPLSNAETWQADLASIIPPLSPMQIPVAAMIPQAIISAHSRGNVISGNVGPF